MVGASLRQCARRVDAAERGRAHPASTRHLTAEPLAATREEDGRWIGDSVQQWIDELTTAVLDYHAAGFIYRSPDDTPANEALARWATEIVPAVREAITR